MEKTAMETVLDPKFWHVDFPEPVIEVVPSEEKEKPYKLKPRETKAHLKSKKKNKKDVTVDIETGPDKFLVQVGKTSVDLMPEGPTDQFLVNGKLVSTEELSEMIGSWDSDNFRDDPTALSEIQQIFYAIGAYGVIQLPDIEPENLEARSRFSCKIGCATAATILTAAICAVAAVGCGLVCAGVTIVLTGGTITILCVIVAGICVLYGARCWRPLYDALVEANC